MGRPTKYAESTLQRAEALAGTGLGTASIAAALGVHRDTLDNWLRRKPELREALEQGRNAFRSGLVEKNLFKRIEGYFYEEKTEELRKIRKNDPVTGEIVTTEKPVVVKTVRRHVPPDTRAIIFAAKCLLPDKYKDKQEVQISGFAEFMAELQEARKRALCGRPK